MRKEWFSSLNQKQEKRMIMSKKKRKLTNTFLQSKNKKKKNWKELVKNEMKQTETSTISSPIEITSNTYGCELVKKEELPFFVKKIISKMRLPNLIKVPQRKRGMTSSGQEYCCHRNVNTLIQVHGGKRMLGYSVKYNKYEVHIFSHSVWITPENELVDVTIKTEEQTSWKQNKYDLDYEYFIPITEIDFTKGDGEIRLKDLNIPKKYKRFGYKCSFHNGTDFLLKTKSGIPTLKDLIGEEIVFFEKDFEKLEDKTKSEKDSVIGLLKDVMKESMEGWFSLPSLFTGKRLSVDLSSLKVPLVYTGQVIQR